VLAESGYAGLTMDAVAAAAGVGKATIYRRWRTKSDLVVDAVTELGQLVTPAPDTGSLEGDLRVQLRWLVRALNGRLGAATLALVSALPHEPGLREAVHKGPLQVWTETFRDIWARAEARGEMLQSVHGTVVASTASAPILQRWLFGRPIDEAFADEVLSDVVLPLLAVRRAA